LTSSSWVRNNSFIGALSDKPRIITTKEAFGAKD